MPENEFSGTVYQPATAGFPMLAIIFKNGELVSYKEVSSVEEGQAVVEEAVRTLPALG